MTGVLLVDTISAVVIPFPSCVFLEYVNADLFTFGAGSNQPGQVPPVLGMLASGVERLSRRTRGQPRVRPVKAIILSAGQGKCLLPLTANRPKCLIPISGRTVLEWQIRSLAAAGVREVAVVTGFRAEVVETAIRLMDAPGVRVRTVFNPHFAVSDNLVSCWAARQEMTGEFLILNGDTVFEPAAAARLLAAPPEPILVTIDRKPEFDDDDMKVMTNGDRLLAVGKKLPAEEANGESIGFLRFSLEGARYFVGAMAQILEAPDGRRLWYLSVIDRIAKQAGNVGFVSIEGLDWCEIDFPADVRRCEAMTGAWLATSRGAAALLDRRDRLGAEPAGRELEKIDR